MVLQISMFIVFTETILGIVRAGRIPEKIKNFVSQFSGNILFLCMWVVMMMGSADD